MCFFFFFCRSLRLSTRDSISSTKIQCMNIANITRCRGLGLTIFFSLQVHSDFKVSRDSSWRFAHSTEQTAKERESQYLPADEPQHEESDELRRRTQKTEKERGESERNSMGVVSLFFKICLFQEKQTNCPLFR